MYAAREYDSVYVAIPAEGTVTINYPRESSSRYSCDSGVHLDSGRGGDHSQPARRNRVPLAARVSVSIREEGGTLPLERITPWFTA